MDLVVFTAHYPYGLGESFFEAELMAAGKQFEKITLITMATKEGSMRKIPENCTVVNLRDKRLSLVTMLRTVLPVICHLPRELHLAGKYGYKPSAGVIKKIVLHCYFLSLLLESKELEKIDYKNTVLYSYWFNVTAYFVAWCKAHHPEAFVITRAHGSDVYMDKFYEPFREYELRHLNGIYTVCEKGKESIESLLYPLVNHPPYIKTARLGVNTPNCVFPKDRYISRSLVTCSNVIPVKRLNLLIEALALLDSTEISWTHFGDGASFDAIQSLAKEKLDAKRNIRYAFRGRLPMAEIMQFYEDQPPELFVNCSSSEGVPVSVMEAFSYGIPVLATDVGGTSEIVSNGVNGFLLPSDITADELAAELEHFFLRNEREKKQLRIGAYQTYSDICDAANNYRSFFEDVKHEFGKKE